MPRTNPNDPVDRGLGRDPIKVAADTEPATDVAPGPSLVGPDAMPAARPRPGDDAVIGRFGKQGGRHNRRRGPRRGAVHRRAADWSGNGFGPRLPGAARDRPRRHGPGPRRLDLSLDRDVALKILLPGANADRFVRESKITARLPHPGIPPVHALGTLADGSPFLAMKLIAGQTLADEMKTADRPRLLQAFTQVCQAVGFAHSRGVIHRDLKPANVMVGAFGEVQVMDWGLAKDLTSRDRRGRAPLGGGAADPASARTRTRPSTTCRPANRPTTRRRPGRCWARRRTWRPSRPAARRPTPAPTCSRWAASCAPS